jgi:hypothetical protein
MFPFNFFKPDDDAKLMAYEFKDKTQREVQLNQLGLIFGEREVTFYNWKVRT